MGPTEQKRTERNTKCNEDKNLIIFIFMKSEQLIEKIVKTQTMKQTKKYRNAKVKA